MTTALLRQYVNEAIQASRPIETRLDQLVADAKRSQKNIEVYSHWGSFPEFDRRVNKMVVHPTGTIEFFKRDGTSMGTFTVQELTSEYPDDLGM